jgi:CheY-like chemotaxis protein
VGKDHVVDVSIAQDAMCVRTDFNQLELAMLNLVINARDAMPGGGTIRVEARLDRGVVVIRVIDQGEGMSAETRQRAFEPFFTTKATGRGTGLGLAQVFGVMEQSGGSIDIDSQVGSGTTITLRLPVCDEEPAPRQRLSESQLGAVVTPLRLLIVDDDAAVRGAIARTFEDDGHVVDSVGDARIALTAIEHCDYDLAIVDFAMPVMDGAELIRAARKLRPAQKFLMVTGYSDSEAVSGACPDTPVIRKPFEGDALRARVLALVG